MRLTRLYNPVFLSDYQDGGDIQEQKQKLARSTVVYRKPRVLGMIFLGFSAGLPFLLVSPPCLLAYGCRVIAHPDRLFQLGGHHLFNKGVLGSGHRSPAAAVPVASAGAAQKMDVAETQVCIALGLSGMALSNVQTDQPDRF